MAKKKYTKAQRRALRIRYQEEKKSLKPIFFHVLQNDTFYCPICQKRHDMSSYLEKTFRKDKKAMWLANMVMHYRHEHITWWNKCWTYGGYRYRKAAHFKDYNEEKSKVNEQAKRQIARKCKSYLKEYDIGLNAFKALQGTTQKTIETVNKVLLKD